ncbi:hypothetical protein BCR39DRAFT_386566 [Naematelia encephala]|uniref:Uncharacterized protein n=1 Tax=Naematelia encephala TaxID=71784 RepID=A0A1Y2AIA8_9TREE|nr:hypothetical protein BCR39DRAFT_386566 [Naematelia encephala]
MASEASVSTPPLDATVDVDGFHIGTVSDLGLSPDSPTALALLPSNMLPFGFRSVQQGIECIDDHHGWGLAPNATVGYKWYPYGYSHPKFSCDRQATAGRPTIIVRVEPIEHGLHKGVALLPCWGCLLSSSADCTVKGAVARYRGPLRTRPPRVLASLTPSQTSSAPHIRTLGASTAAIEINEAGAKRLKRLHNTSPSESAAHAGEYWYSTTTATSTLVSSLGSRLKALKTKLPLVLRVLCTLLRL